MRRLLRFAPLAAVPVLFALSGSAQDVSRRTEAALEALDRAAAPAGREVAPDGFWDAVRKIEEEGRDALPALQEGLRRASPWVRIASARSLYSLRKKPEAAAALMAVLQKNQTPAARRLAARVLAGLVARDTGFGDVDALREDLLGLIRDAEEPLVRIDLCRALWAVDEDITAIRELRKLVRADDSEVRAESALALAGMDAFESAQASLQELGREPTERGRLALAYLDNYRLQQEVERKTAPAPAPNAARHDYRLLDEMIELLRKQYHDTTKVDVAKLIEAAAKGLGSSLDPFSAYLDADDLRKLDESLNQKYGGIGARVSMRRDKGGHSWLTVERPIYSGPAYTAGIRSHDRIVEVEGESTVDHDLQELVSKLRGDPDSKVKFKVYRNGWTKPKDFEIVRASVKVDSTLPENLPAGIGYLQLTTFGEENAAEFSAALKRLEKDGMKAMVLDLRGNPGGYLSAAVAISEKFLEKGKLVVRTRAQGAVVDEKLSREASPRTLPLIVLVDGGSASASEIVSGSLQGHKRATLVGTRTFGKGSVQQVPRLQTSSGKTAFRLTIARYYLPTTDPAKEDRSIDRDGGEGGIQPDIVVEPQEPDFWRAQEFEKIRQTDLLDVYTEKLWEKDRALVQALADDDGGTIDRYPGYAELHAGLVEKLKSRLNPEDLRELVREYFRRKVADSRGKDYTVDLQADAQLQRGVFEACRRINVDPAGVPLYASFARKIQEELARPPGDTPVGVSEEHPAEAPAPVK